jgi:GNAT superfamily N-acetyltransferase
LRVARVAVRAAVATDAGDIASVHTAAWRAAFTFLPAAFLAAMTAKAVLGKWEVDLAAPSTPVFVAVDDGSVVGFLQVRLDGRHGEVMSLYVDPSSWRNGVGSALLTFGEGWLSDRGAATAMLWTAKESRQSRRFYERRGWVLSGDEQTQYLGPGALALHEVEYRKALGMTSR